MDRKAFHRSEYLGYSLEQLAELTERIASNREAYTIEAREAWKEVLLERNLDAQGLLRNRQASRMEELQELAIAKKRKDERSKKVTRRLGKFLGLLGIPMSIGIAALSIADSHMGGLVASIVFLGYSIWLAFFYRGD